jgi:hypothetical protein
MIDVRSIVYHTEKLILSLLVQRSRKQLEITKKYQDIMSLFEVKEVTKWENQ